MDDLSKLIKRIQVHDKYAIAASVFILDLGLFDSSDIICKKIATQYKLSPSRYVNVYHIAMLKERMVKYAEVIFNHGGIPKELIQQYHKDNESIKENSSKKAFLIKGTFKKIQLVFDFDPVIIENIKKLEKPRYSPKSKTWDVNLNISNLEGISALGFVLDSELENWNKQWNYKYYKPFPVKKINNVKLKLQLREFQKEGIAYAISRNNRALIGDEMGLGKTPSAIGWAEYLKERPVLIVCPASLKYNWAKEIKKWVYNPTIYILQGTPNKELDHKQIYSELYLYHKGDINTKNTYVIINYDIIPNRYNKIKNDEGKIIYVEVKNSRWVDYLHKANIKCLVLDEVQYIKNKSANRTEAVLKLGKQVHNLLALSGTPIDNKTIEFFNVLNLINPYQFSNKMAFALRYCNAKKTAFGWDFNGASNLKELHTLVTNSVMIRRLKENVLTELPPKNRILIDIDIENRREYEHAKNDLMDWLVSQGNIAKVDSAKKAKALFKLNALLQLTLKGKIKYCVEWIKTYLENKDKLVCFVTHTETIKILLKEFGHYEKNSKGIAVEVDGSVNVKKRQEYVDIFESDPRCKLFIGNLIAAGAGLTLVSASDVCFVELGMVPGHHLQAEDRVHRIGQKSMHVNAYYLIARDTVENDIAELLSTKYSVLKTALDGIEISDMDADIQQHTMLVNLVDRLNDKQ